MNTKKIDQLISSLLVSCLFFISLSFYFAITDYKILNLHNDIIFYFVVIPVVFFIYWIIGKLKLNILEDICKWF